MIIADRKDTKQQVVEYCIGDQYKNDDDSAFIVAITLRIGQKNSDKPFIMLAVSSYMQLSSPAHSFFEIE